MVDIQYGGLPVLAAPGRIYHPRQDIEMMTVGSR